MKQASTMKSPAPAGFDEWAKLVNPVYRRWIRLKKAGDKDIRFPPCSSLYFLPSVVKILHRQGRIELLISFPQMAFFCQKMSQSKFLFVRLTKKPQCKLIILLKINVRNIEFPSDFIKDDRVTLVHRQIEYHEFTANENKIATYVHLCCFAFLCSHP
ncbi:hypothetical protein DB48_17695 [Shewanella sp. cp20]|nr:hypothetical protein DB48_17695 [Shewanella sp. cp20]